jgi:hypothetical protein
VFGVGAPMSAMVVARAMGAMPAVVSHPNQPDALEI